MQQPTLFKACVFLMLLLCQSVYAKDLQNATYKISSFKLDLTESVSFAQFLKEDEFSFVVRDSMELMLKRVNKLAAEDEARPVELDIYIDYYRRFVGDASPWPIASLAPPNLYITIKAQRDGKNVFSVQTKELVNLSGGFDFFLAKQPDYYKKDYARAYELAAELVSYIAKHAKDFAPPRPQELADLSLRAETYHAKFGAPSNPAMAFYVPDDAAEPYILALSDSSARVRINNLSAITQEWIFNEKLVAAVRAHIEELRQHPGNKDAEKELRYAMNSLASFGLVEDLAVFEEINSTTGYGKNVYKEVEDSKNILKKRNDQNPLVHQFAPELAGQPWEIRQLVNRLNLADAKDVLQAISRVKQAYPQNTLLLDAMKARLEREALVLNYKARTYAGVNAHFCRVIGSSGNPAYLEFLEMMAEKAVVDYTREHCEAGLEVMSKQNKDLVKQLEKERKQQAKLAKQEAKLQAKQKSKQEKKAKN